MKTQINQKELIERLKMPLNAIQSLKKNNTLKFEKVGRECFFDVESVEEFERSFNMKDYLTVSECKAKLEELNFYTFVDRRYNIYVSNLGIYITVKHLIDGDGGRQIPNEYRLEAKWFGVTKYISKKSFKKTLKWLKTVHPSYQFDQRPKRELKDFEELSEINYAKVKSAMSLSPIKYSSLKYAAFRRNPSLLIRKILSEL
jgi:hypothetical protein